MGIQIIEGQITKDACTLIEAAILFWGHAAYQPTSVQMVGNTHLYRDDASSFYTKY